MTNGPVKLVTLPRHCPPIAHDTPDVPLPEPVRVPQSHPDAGSGTLCPRSSSTSTPTLIISSTLTQTQTQERMNAITNTSLGLGGGSSSSSQVAGTSTSTPGTGSAGTSLKECPGTPAFVATAA